jgi:hypothetical protein
VTFWDQVGTIAALIGGRAVQFLGAAAALGLLTMAVIQTARDLLPLRRRFQRRYVNEWLRGRARQAGGAADAARAEEDLVRLAAAGDGDALYQLPIEQLSGQLATAATLVLEFPGGHPDLLACLAAEAGTGDADAVLLADRLGRTGLESLRGSSPDEFQRLVDARTRMTHQVQRALDALQISAGARWKLMLQIAAFPLGCALAVGGAALVRLPQSGIATPLAAALPLGLAAGFLAPIARDLVALLDRARRP